MRQTMHFNVRAVGNQALLPALAEQGKLRTIKPKPSHADVEFAGDT